MRSHLHSSQHHHPNGYDNHGRDITTVVIISKDIPMDIMAMEITVDIIPMNIISMDIAIIGLLNQTVNQRYHPSATILAGGTACCLVTLPFCVMPILVTIIVLFHFFARITVPVAGILGLLLIVLVVCLVRAFKRRQNVSCT